MGRFNLSDDREDLNRIRSERAFDSNPPESEPGQGDDWDDLFDEGGDSDMDDFDFGSSDSFDSVGNSFDEIGRPGGLGSLNDMSGSGFNLGGSLMGGSQIPQQNQKRSLEEALESGLESALTGAGKGLTLFFPELLESFKNNTALEWHHLGGVSMVLGAIVGGVGLLFMIIGIFAGIDVDSALSLFIGALFTEMFGVMMLSFNDEKARDLAKKKKEEVEQSTELEEEYLDDIDDDFDEDTPDDFDLSDGFEEDEEEEDIIEDVDYSKVFESALEDCSEENNKKAEDLVEELGEVPKGMYTRQYLYETFLKSLPAITPDFHTMREIPEGSDDFDDFESVLIKSSRQSGIGSDDKLPILEALRENEFIIQLKATRPPGIKEQIIADGIVSMYKLDDQGRSRKGREGAYATIVPMVGSFLINLFKGCNPIIGLGDVLRQSKDHYLDTSIEMPMAWGVNELGDPWLIKGEKLLSAIVSGAPRRGKSLQVQSMLCQFFMFTSPRDAHFYIYDAKGPTSDYYALSAVMPHIKDFQTDIRAIINSINNLVTIEANRRNKIFESKGLINITDFRRKHPDIDMPLIYVVIDEMQSLTSGISKEEKDEFRVVLDKLVTKLPNLGFRPIFIPHRIVDDVIPKKISPLVGSRASFTNVMEEVSRGLEITKTQFPYTLPNQGDSALRDSNLNGGNAVFSHGFVLSRQPDSIEDIMNVFRYIGLVWRRLEPEEKGYGDKGKTKLEKTVDRTEGKEEYSLSSKDIEDGSYGESSSEDDFWESMLQ